MRLRNGPRRPITAHRPQAGRSWYRIADRAAVRAEEAEADKRVSVYLFDEIGGWGVTAGEFVAELRGLDAEAIDLHINSPGGDVFDGVAIYNALLSHAATVTVYVDGLAASAASFIAQAGDRVVMARNATMMIHDASGFCYGPASDMRTMADLLDKVSDNIADIYASRTGTPATKWRAAMLAETWYSAEEAVKAGLASEVAPVEERDAEAEADAQAWVRTMFARRGLEQAPAAVVPGPRATTGPEPEPVAVAEAAPVVEPEPVAEAEPEPEPVAAACTCSCDTCTDGRCGDCTDECQECEDSGCTCTDADEEEPDEEEPDDVAGGTDPEAATTEAPEATDDADCTCTCDECADDRCEDCTDGCGRRKRDDADDEPDDNADPFAEAAAALLTTGTGTPANPSDLPAGPVPPVAATRPGTTTTETADAWADLVSRLVGPPSPHTADDVLARMKGALL